MITYMKSIQSTTYLLYSFGTFVLNNKFVFPPPPQKYKTASQLASSDLIQQGINKSKALKQAKLHPKYEEFVKQSQQDKENYHQQLQEYEAKYKYIQTTSMGVMNQYLYNKYKDHQFKPKYRLEYYKILDVLPQEQKEADLQEIQQIWEKRKQEIAEHNQQLIDKYQVPIKLSFRQFICSQKKITPANQKEKVQQISEEELKQLKADYQKHLELTQAKYQQLANLFGLTVDEFQQELKLQKRQALQERKKKQKEEESSSSSEDDKKEKKEKEEKKD